MRAIRLWRTYKTIHLEKSLKATRGIDGRVLRTYAAGKKFK